jgi:hypothetical protein
MGQMKTVMSDFIELRRQEREHRMLFIEAWVKLERYFGAEMDRTEIDMLIELEDGEGRIS